MKRRYPPFLAATLLLAATALPLRAQDAALTRYAGTAQNGSYRGSVLLDVSSADRSNRVTGHLHFGQGLAGDADLEGERDGDVLRLTGVLSASGARYQLQLYARLSGNQLAAAYGVAPVGGGASQRGEIHALAERAPQRADAPEAHPSHELQSYHGAGAIRVNTPDDYRYWKKHEGDPASVDVRGFFRTWTMGVEGAHYTVDDYAAGTRTTTSTTGVLSPNQLRIDPDGSYTWGRIHGRWRRTPNAEWPIELVAAQEGSDWGVGWDTRSPSSRGNILVGDGNSYYFGLPR